MFYSLECNTPSPPAVGVCRFQPTTGGLHRLASTSRGARVWQHVRSTAGFLQVAGRIKGVAFWVALFVPPAGDKTASRSTAAYARPELLEAARPQFVLAIPHAMHESGPGEVCLRRGDGAVGGPSAVLTATDEFGLSLFLSLSCSLDFALPLPQLSQAFLFFSYNI